MNKGEKMTNKKTLCPNVNKAREFMEIAFDFSNPLDLVREAISNAFDAQANVISMEFTAQIIHGKKVFIIKMHDNGNGMDMDGLQSFFDLGNSLSANDENKIGEKGHGTKVYLNCNKIEVFTQKNGKKYTAVMEEPKYRLFEGKLPEVNVNIDETSSVDSWTEIVIYGYNNDDRRKFTHEQLKDYILWFTKMGSVEQQFNVEKYKDVILRLKGVDRKESEGFEEIKFGHIFPAESVSVNELLEKYVVKAPDYYCKRWDFRGKLDNLPEVEYEAVYYLEGNRIKQSYNSMIRRQGYTPPIGAYSVQDRYGIWLCKDYIPIQRKNEWITKKGSEYTRFHAFINCQELRLTANRGSVENTPSEVIQDLQAAVERDFESILSSSEWFDVDYLEEEAEAYNTMTKEERDYKKRIDMARHAKIATYKGVHLVEPQKEQGVYSLFLQISQIEPSLFPFYIIDYDTHSGIDVIVKDNRNSLPLKQDTLYYVEFKNELERNFNHSFAHLHTIVCWKLKLINGQEIEDVAKKKRIVRIVPPVDENDYTHYYLDDPRGSLKIEVFVLQSFLKEKLKIDFRTRTEKDCF